ncbi:hypothetical protein GCM10023075_25660 [Streptosporangium album]|uniref:anti-sigma factor n=1 Tax=Streptosporangium album TaxID=47479 RepID=UPI0031F1342C
MRRQRSGAASGTVRGAGAGGNRLQVRLTGLPAPGGLYEVWLLDRAAKRMISLGTVGPSGQASYPLPVGITTSDYPVVDVSREPLDGNPGHFSDSFLRGTLPSYDASPPRCDGLALPGWGG